MKVTLLHSTPLWVCARAIRTCWNSHDKSDTEFLGFDRLEDKDPKQTYFVAKCGEKDKELIARVGNKNKHKSVLEHLVYSFEIDGISRACLQELARHRIASYSVQSSRYVLHKLLKTEEPFDDVCSASVIDRAKKYIVLSESLSVQRSQILALEELRVLVNQGIANDVVKYAMPECFKTSLVWTINARSLQNFLELRTSRSALPEIRRLALAVFKALPADHKYLFEEYVNEKI